MGGYCKVRGWGHAIMYCMVVVNIGEFSFGDEGAARAAFWSFFGVVVVLTFAFLFIRV